MFNWKNKCESDSVPYSVPRWQGSNCNMVNVVLIFEELKQIIKWYRRPRTDTSHESATAVLELFQHLPQKSSRQAARESDVSASSVLRILRKGKFHVYIPRLMQGLSDDDPDRRHNCVYWAEDNPRIRVQKAVNFPGVNVWCSLSARGLITGETYLTMLAGLLFPAIRALYSNDDFYFQQDGAPPHYHRDVRAYLDHYVPGQWIGRRGPIEFSALSPDLSPLDFFLWGTVKDEVYKRKPRHTVK
ncbi:Protein of unknown function DUF4817 [Biomphalaria glabrata]|nr:Protein of unknown function DUF4817 [Biomphalaria glabrata]